MKISFVFLALVCVGLAQAQAPAPSASWRVEKLADTESRLVGPGDNSVRLVGLTPDARIELSAATDTQAIAVLIRHRKFTDLLAYRIGLAGLEEIKLPELPAGDILKNYPTSGKPAGLRRPRLDSMSIEKVGWATGGRLAARIELELVDEETRETGWAYAVDAVWSLPPIDSPAGTPAVLTVLNIHLARKGA